jgi:hypothetical protein
VGRAEALALAGHGHLAAEAYLEARQGAPSKQVAELTHKAGEQYLLCGQLDRGGDLMREALAAGGIGFPRSFVAAMASFVYQRARLRVRGLAFEPRGTASGDVARVLDALNATTHAMLRCDPVRAATFSALSARRALDCGDPVRAARALGWELLQAANVGARPAQLAALSERAQAMCELADDPGAWEALHFGRAYERMLAADSVVALGLFERLIAYYADHPQLAAYNRPWAEAFLAITLIVGRGSAREVADTLPGHIEGARSRGDMTVLPMWSGMYGAFARIAVGRIDDAKREIERTSSEWRPPEFTIQSLNLAVGRYFVERYRDGARAAWDVVDELRREIEASLMARTTIGTVFRGLYGGAAVGLAAETSDSSERRHLLDIARRTASIEGTAPAGMIPIRAAIACVRGQPERAINALRNFMASAAVPPLFKHAARRRLGVLLGGEEGKALVTEADAFFRLGGAIDPERMVALLAPACEIR